MTAPLIKWGRPLLGVAAIVIAVGLYFLYRSVTDSTRYAPPPLVEPNREAPAEAYPSQDPNQLMTDPPPVESSPQPLTLEVRAQFEALLAQTLEKLPTTAAVRDMTEEETHHGPEALDEGGSQLGAVADALNAQPELAPRAQRFYEECALKEGVLTPIRALCLATGDSLIKRFPAAGLSPLDHGKFSSELIELSSRVNPR